MTAERVAFGTGAALAGLAVGVLVRPALLDRAACWLASQETRHATRTRAWITRGRR